VLLKMLGYPLLELIDLVVQLDDEAGTRDHARPEGFGDELRCF